MSIMSKMTLPVPAGPGKSFQILLDVLLKGDHLEQGTTAAPFEGRERAYQ